MRIVQVARHIRSGSGVAGVVNALEREFTGLGLECERYTLEDAGLRMRSEIGRGPLAKLSLLVEVVWFTVAGTRAVRRWRGSAGVKVIVHGDPIGGDIYVNHGLLLAARRAQGLGPIPANPMHWFTLLRDRWRYRHEKQGVIVCLNNWDRDALIDLYRPVPSEIRVIPNGVDLRRFENRGENGVRQRVRAELNIQDDELALVFVGHEFERKGLFLLCQALPMLDPHLKIIVVGGSEDMVKNGIMRTRDLCRDGRVRFIGRQADPRPYYLAADMMGLPSAYEADPLVLLEALASGLPCISTAVGSAGDLIRDGVTGCVVERSADSVAAGIRVVEGMLASSGRDAVADRCRSAVAERSWRTVAGKYLELLEEDLS
jgi:glycosyltransferase involved in cell wall biosynthesis